MKVILLADTHFGVRGESQIFLDYFTKFYREVFFPYIDEHNIKVVVHLGDLVDRRKYLNYTVAHTMRTEYINQSIHRNLITHIICGNHDTFHKNNNEVNALAEFVMGRPGFSVYAAAPAEIELGKLKVLMMPWISPENQEKSAYAIQASKAPVMFAHLELAGFEMARGQMMEHGMDADAFQKFKAVYTGHYHHKSSKGNIHYLGAPYEMTWADCEDPKGFHVFDTETMEIEFIQNPFTLYQKVHVTKETKTLPSPKDKFVKLIVHEGTDRKLLDKLVSKSEAIDLQVIDNHLVADVASHLVVDNVEDTMQIVSDYIMSSDLTVDKDALVGVMKELYLEAQT